VRPHLEFATAALSPWTTADKECLEKVQRRAVAMVSGLTGQNYKEEIAELGMLSLEERRHQMEMCLVHKIMHREGNLDPATWFERTEQTVGGHATRSTIDPLNIKVRKGRLDVRRNFFSMRVIEDWNRIPADLKANKGAAKFKATHKKMQHPTRTA
jgi:hypothetical protein